jgi:Na+:H+ antiporter, NhaA family
MARHGLMSLINFALDNSLLLFGGALAASVWANVDLTTYEHIAHPLHFWVNDLGMVFFFALAGKEVFEATPPGGALASPARASAPLAAAIGGMVIPAAIYVTLASSIGPSVLLRGWAIACATDIAFSALIARAIFPARHPAIPFLLLLAIADDALGLIILAVFYPSGPLSIVSLVIVMAAALLAALWLKRRGVRSFWPYVVGPGSLSWAALYFGGFHPALAMVPIVPFMPHAPDDMGLFEPREALRANTLDQFEHWWAKPVQVVLLLFGFANAGVPVAQIGPGTYYVLTALLLGKPIGILLFVGGARMIGARLPTGLHARDILVVGIAAATGFTVSLFLATAAFAEVTLWSRPRWARCCRSWPLRLHFWCLGLLVVAAPGGDHHRAMDSVASADDSRCIFSLARSLRLARRIAPARKGATHLENPAGVPRFRRVIRVPPSDVVSQMYEVSMGNGPSAVRIIRRSPGTKSTTS